jgi:hypothetical protein
VTANDLIVLALKLCGVIGVGQTASTDDLNDGFTMLTQMMATWQRKRWLTYHLQDVAFTPTGAQSYTIGSGGTINVTRPDRIEAAFVRQLIPGGANQVDFPMRVIDDREDYALIAVKQISASPPTTIFYDPDFPLGNVYVWPLAGNQYEIHLLVKQPLQSFASLSDTINLPQEYLEALMWNLAARLRPMYGLGPEPTIAAEAKASLDTLRVANTQLARLRLPSDVPGQGWGGSWFNSGGIIESNFVVDESALT